MQIGDKVVIGGRTMLRPGFSLVGFTGTIVETAANAPAGTHTVQIDWQAAGYDDTASLPALVNVPAALPSLFRANTTLRSEAAIASGWLAVSLG